MVESISEPLKAVLQRTTITLPPEARIQCYHPLKVDAGADVPDQERQDNVTERSCRPATEPLSLNRTRTQTRG